MLRMDGNGRPSTERSRSTDLAELKSVAIQGEGLKRCCLRRRPRIYYPTSLHRDDFLTTFG
jgi:hypothetical protein